MQFISFYCNFLEFRLFSNKQEMHSDVLIQIMAKLSIVILRKSGRFQLCISNKSNKKLSCVGGARTALSQNVDEMIRKIVTKCVGYEREWCDFQLD